MNDDIKDKLLWRATIIENSESLIKSCSRINKNQLSLFEEVKNDAVELKSPQDLNYDLMVEKEVDVLGVALTYNIQDKYILHTKRFCNHTLRSINELMVDEGRIVFIAKINDIEYRTSMAGNNYAKIFWKDFDSTTRMYLFGDMYQKLISKAFKGRYYLCECSYNKDKDSLNIVNFKAIEELEIKEYINEIVLVVDDPEKLPELRNYVWKNMIGDEYKLTFLYKGVEFSAPYKIKFSEENYLDIKDLITNINVKHD
jgi:DNA polymerase III alpha subunit